MPNSSATRRMVRACGPSRTRTPGAAAKASRPGGVIGSATRRADGLLGPALERLVHEAEGGQGAALQGPCDERHQHATEMLLLDEPGGPRGPALQAEGVVGVEHTGEAEAAEPPQQLALAYLDDGGA